MGTRTRRAPPPSKWAAGAAPHAHPGTYPGAWPRTCTVITGTHIYTLRYGTPRGGKLGAVPARAYGQPRHTVATLLDGAGAPPVAGRVPVLAVGCNAAPAHLRYLYAGQLGALCIPQVWARVPGVAAVYAPHPTPGGVLTATAYAVPGHTAHLPVQLVCPAQLAVLDGAAGAGYTRVWLPWPVPLAGGGVLPGVFAYVAVAGCLVGPDGQPLHLSLPRNPGGYTQGGALGTLGLGGTPVAARVAAAVGRLGRAAPGNGLHALPGVLGVPPGAGQYAVGV